MTKASRGEKTKTVTRANRQRQILSKKYRQREVQETQEGGKTEEQREGIKGLGAELKKKVRPKKNTTKKARAVRFRHKKNTTSTKGG